MKLYHVTVLCKTHNGDTFQITKTWKTINLGHAIIAMEEWLDTNMPGTNIRRLISAF